MSGEEQAIEVWLNVYDVAPPNGDGQGTSLIRINNITRDLGFGGVFHGAIVLTNTEVSFGFCERGTGVYTCQAKGNPMYTFRESISLGPTSLSRQEVKEVLVRMRAEWQGHTYDLLSRNCCHFCEALATALSVKPIPGWVNRLAANADATVKTTQHALAAVRTFGQEVTRVSGESLQNLRVGLSKTWAAAVSQQQALQQQMQQQQRPAASTGDRSDSSTSGSPPSSVAGGGGGASALLARAQNSLVTGLWSRAPTNKWMLDTLAAATSLRYSNSSGGAGCFTGAEPGQAQPWDADCGGAAPREEAVHYDVPSALRPAWQRGDGGNAPAAGADGHVAASTAGVGQVWAGGRQAGDQGAGAAGADVASFAQQRRLEVGSSGGMLDFELASDDGDDALPGSFGGEGLVQRCAGLRPQVPPHLNASN